jgi:hypothetical protein
MTSPQSIIQPISGIGSGTNKPEDHHALINDGNTTKENTNGTAALLGTNSTSKPAKKEAQPLVRLLSFYLNPCLSID